MSEKYTLTLDCESGYLDPDTVILYACFAALGLYIEEMGGLEQIDKFNAELRDPTKQDPNDPEGSENFQADRQEEAATLWRWWTGQRPADQAREGYLLDKLFGRDDSFDVAVKFNEDQQHEHNELLTLQDKIDADEQEMLHRLIVIRRSLWT